MYKGRKRDASELIKVVQHQGTMEEAVTLLALVGKSNRIVSLD